MVTAKQSTQCNWVKFYATSFHIAIFSFASAFDKVFRIDSMRLAKKSLLSWAKTLVQNRRRNGKNIQNGPSSWNWTIFGRTLLCSVAICCFIAWVACRFLWALALFVGRLQCTEQQSFLLPNVIIFLTAKFTLNDFICFYALHVLCGNVFPLRLLRSPFRPFFPLFSLLRSTPVMNVVSEMSTESALRRDLWDFYWFFVGLLMLCAIKSMTETKDRP